MGTSDLSLVGQKHRSQPGLGRVPVSAKDLLPALAGN